MCTGLRLSEDLQFDEIASLTPGFVGADLVSLTREAAMFAVQRYTSLNHSRILLKLLFYLSQRAARKIFNIIKSWLFVA